MSKLYFEDDNGNTHDISLQTIKSSGIKKGDIVLVSYEVGDAPPKESQIALNQLHSMFEKILPEGVKTAVIATRQRKEDISIKIMKDNTGA